VTLGTLATLGLLAGALALLIARARKSPRHSRAAAPPPTLAGRTPGLADVPPTLLLQPRAALRIVSGPGRGREIRLDPKRPMSMGRSQTNELVLEDDAISGQHCRVRHEDEGWVLHDLGSTNGTRVNERRVDRHRLKGGDLISLGETSLQFLER
jgi:pSer/pThr/pTyr-binding forkhead associated (FHA) protein